MLDSPHFRVDPTQVLALEKYTVRGYAFIRMDQMSPGESGRGTLISSERTWDDSSSINMAFDDAYPVTLFPRLRWTTCVRVFEETGYYDVGPTATVSQEGDEFVMMNQLELKRVTMAPESF